MTETSGDAPTVKKINGYSLMRTSYTLLYVAPPEDEQGVRWRLSPGTSETGGDPVIIGDLTSRTEDCFAGVQVLAFLGMTDDEQVDEADWRRANQIVEAHAAWVTDGLYDYAAQTMRAMTSGASYSPTVPRETPPFELNLVTFDEQGDPDHVD